MELLQQKPRGSCAAGFCRLGCRTLGVVVGPPGLFLEAAGGGPARAQVPAQVLSIVGPMFQSSPG